MHGAFTSTQIVASVSAAWRSKGPSINDAIPQNYRRRRECDVVLMLVAAWRLGRVRRCRRRRSADADMTLLLGEPPAGVHAGIFLATSRGYDEAEGVELDVRGAGDPSSCCAAAASRRWCWTRPVRGRERCA